MRVQGETPPLVLVAFQGWLCTQLLVFPVTFPLLLRTLQLIESICSNKAPSLLCLLFLLSGVFIAFFAGSWFKGVL